MNRRRYDLHYKTSPQKNKEVQSSDSPKSFNNEKKYYKIGEITFDEKMGNYLQEVVSVVEGRKVFLDEILHVLRKKERQRSMVKQKKIGYAGNYQRTNPP